MIKYYDFDFDKLANDVVVKKNRHHYSYKDIADRTGLHPHTIRAIALKESKRSGARNHSTKATTSLIMWLGFDFNRYVIEIPVEFGNLNGIS